MAILHRPAAFSSIQITANATLEIQFDPPDHFLGGDHVQAMRQRSDDIRAQILRPVLLVAIAEWNGAGFPAAAVVAAGQCAVGVKVLMMRIHLPLHWLAPSGHDHTGAILGMAAFDFHGGREVHGEGHRAEHSLRMIHQPHKLPGVRLPAQIGHALERGIVMALLAYLYELDFIPEMIHYLLIPGLIPLF